MSSQQLDLSRSWAALRRKRKLIVLLALLGLCCGLVLAAVFPAMPTGKALVVLAPPEPGKDGVAPERDIQTQVLVANSTPILDSAGRQVQPPLRSTVVKKRVRVTAVTQEILEIEAAGTSPKQARQLANAVAGAYVGYVTESRHSLPKGSAQRVDARILEPATTTTGGNVFIHLAIYGAVGAAAVTLLMVITVLVAARGDRRLRFRDDIADAVGIPVLASLLTRRATDVAGWAELFERYRPSAVDAWNLRKMLRHFGVGGDEPVAVTVVSFVEDPRALAVGPQIAAFASSIGVATELVVQTKHEAVASLVAVEPAVLAVWDGPRLRTGETATTPHDALARTEPALRLRVVVVGRERPRFVDPDDGSSTVVALTAGRVTAEELARIAVAAADSGRTVDGLLVADPDPTDRTTGRAPHTRRYAASSTATILPGVVRGIRR
ncbi:MAG: hypothetical protein GEV07_10035 [Streptosporangiales bacterium]|nr:hypothetical protein [Streptosporangiales bacterium]